MVKSKKKEDTAEGTITNWIGIFGAPESYFIRKCGCVCVCVGGGRVERGSECNNQFCGQFNIIMKFIATEESWSNGIIEEHNADYLTTSRLFTSSPNNVISIFKRDSSLSKFT